MRAVLLFGLTASLVLIASPAPGAESDFTAAAITEKARLIGARRVRYLLRQIDLTAEQAAYAENLITSVLPPDSHAPTPEPSIDDVRRLWKQLERAREADDQQQVERLTQELKGMGHEADDESDVFATLAPKLTDVQRAKLEQARARLERIPSGAVRPIDLIRAARTLELTGEQQHKLQEATIATNKMLGPILKPNTDLKLKMINFLATEIRSLLAPQQVAAFDHRIRALRPDLIEEGLMVGVPPGEQAP